MFCNVFDHKIEKLHNFHDIPLHMSSTVKGKIELYTKGITDIELSYKFFSSIFYDSLDRIKNLLFLWYLKFPAGWFQINATLKILNNANDLKNKKEEFECIFVVVIIKTKASYVYTRQIEFSL